MVTEDGWLHFLSSGCVSPRRTTWQMRRRGWKSSRELTWPWMQDLNMKSKWGGDGQGNKTGEWRIYVGLESSVFVMYIPWSDAGWIIITNNFPMPAGYIGSDLKRQCLKIKLWDTESEKCPIVQSVLGKLVPVNTLGDISLANLPSNKFIASAWHILGA